MNPEIVKGSFVGTGALVNRSLGFNPDYIRAVNATDGNTIWEWFSGMAAGSSIKSTSGAVATGANGFTSYAGSAVPGSEASPGITFGTDISVNGKTIYFVAMRNGPGV